MIFTESVKNSAFFIRQFIDSPASVGAIAPSSAALCASMTSGIRWERCRSVAELGAGTGVLTRAILVRLSPEASLDVFETNTAFCDGLRSIDDERLNVICASAEDMTGPFDIIFSGLPLLSFSGALRQAILSRVAASLSPSGVFIQFQYSPLLEKTLSRHFYWKRQFQLKNVPPAFVYSCIPAACASSFVD